MPDRQSLWCRAGHLLLVIGIAAVVVVLGVAMTGRPGREISAEPAPCAAVMPPANVFTDSEAPAPESGAAPRFAHWSSPREAAPRQPLPLTEQGSRRDYLLEMAARLRRTTLGNDQLRREGIDPDIYAYQWLGAVQAAPDLPPAS